MYGLDVIVVQLGLTPEEKDVLTSQQAHDRLQEHGVSTFGELLLDCLSGYSAAMIEGDGWIKLTIMDGPGFRTDDDGAWAEQAAGSAFEAAMQFLSAA